jgi:hypothetical protein
MRTGSRKSCREWLAAQLHALAARIGETPVAIVPIVPAGRDAISAFLDDAFKGKPTLDEQRSALEYLAETMVIKRGSDGPEGESIYDELARTIVNWVADRRCNMKEVVLALPDVIAQCLVTFERSERARLLQRVLVDLPEQVALLLKRTGRA